MHPSSSELESIQDDMLWLPHDFPMTPKNCLTVPVLHSATAVLSKNQMPRSFGRAAEHSHTMLFLPGILIVAQIHSCLYGLCRDVVGHVDRIGILFHRSLFSLSPLDFGRLCKIISSCAYRNLYEQHSRRSAVWFSLGTASASLASKMLTLITSATASCLPV